MNFLAHIYLSGTAEKLMIGNFLGDFVKGDPAVQYESEICKGIKLHRGIDVFTDQHLVVKQSKDRLRSTYRHYSGVIVDMYYDHFLAKNWERYHPTPLPTFVQQAYRTLEAHTHIMPKSAQHILPYMIDHDWLTSYAKIEGIGQALTGMSRRTKFVSKMEQATKELEIHYHDFEQEFFTFFPDLKKFVDNWRS